MIIPDANVLLYAVNQDAPQHGPARHWLEATLSGDEAVGWTWLVLLAFLRISTSQRVFDRPLEVDEALALIDGWLERPVSRLVQPGPHHWPLLRQLLSASGTAANLSSDAHLAAIALEQGARLASCDRDFQRFSGLRAEAPLR
ncbi:type II toxin-antitoxin system VapC family toxin [Cyanobium sp. ATX 6F1]|uniref:type II toxin-antitoxin system VapC family toxin n=1 Tax=unclassified Cyanobium TaxID=2627006 RepID=UPI0020CF5919|nr:type II toxin-antitoxin system VapC family toxin [Cyanobium sp. ATX 6F1]MCP9916459.1 type II toxin-antitoxin system VapC family toxin [Cyanobium sp. ATX 6F1]